MREKPLKLHDQSMSICEKEKKEINKELIKETSQKLRYKKQTDSC